MRPNDGAEVCRPFADEDLRGLIWPLRTMAALEAYLDESGTHEGSPWVVLGGGVGPFDAWRLLSSQWQEALQQFGVRNFHATDLQNLRGEFDGWAPDRQKELTASLLKIISREAILPIAAAINVDKYKQVAAEFPHVPLLPYDVCLMFTIGMIRDYRNKIGAEFRIAVTVEEGQHLHDPFIRSLKSPEDIEHYSSALGISMLKSAEKDRNPPVQFADLIAYELYKLLKKHGNKDTNMMRFPLRYLLAHKSDWIHGIAKPHNIRHWLRTMDEWYFGPNPQYRSQNGSSS